MTTTKPTITDLSIRDDQNGFFVSCYINGGFTMRWLSNLSLFGTHTAPDNFTEVILDYLERETGMRDWEKDKRDMKSDLLHAINGGKFEYTSYNHKAAEAEYKGTKDYQDRCQYDMLLSMKSNKIDKYEISP